MRDNKRFAEIREEIAVVRMQKKPNQQYPFALHARIPTEAKVGDTFVISVAQRDERAQTVGGATAVYIIEESGFVGQDR